ncbi:hypothetical protein ZEAMMB73_Zm00001d020979 [Zea mays]|uniref:DM2 domain-containing protein n=1 Tax=Zea mays TaxID=4577 RepID=A0A1D6I7K4_MAIZE|nr:hypothetical protein ZEAMMB73_Zm00001d020979 [Zea mays]
MNSTDCFSRCVERHVYSSYDEFLRLHEDEFHASRSQDSRRPKIVYQFVLVFLFVGMPDSNELMFNTEQPTYNFGAYKNSKLRKRSKRKRIEEAPPKESAREKKRSEKERRAQLDSIHVKSEAAARSCLAFRWIYLANGMWIRSRGNEPCSQVNCKEMVCSQLVLSGDSITEQPFAPVAAVSHWLTPACSRITSFTDYVFSVYLHSVGKLQPHCNKVYKRFAMRKNKFMGSNKVTIAVCIETVLCLELRKTLHGLQNQDKKTDINCDATLRSLFGGRDKVGMLEISKLLSRDFPKISKLLWSMEPGMALW